MKYLKDPDNSVLDKEIRDLRGIVKNTNERAQTIAVGIIEHDIKHGDCSRAVALINALSTGEQRRFMLQFLAYFGAIGVKMERGTATGVGHIDVKSNRYRRPDLDGAKANMWFEPFDASGKKADWYQGPNPNLFVPGTLGDVGQNVIDFADRLDKRLTATRDNGAGEQVPNFQLTDDERHEVEAALAVVRKVGNTIAARERLNEAQALVKEFQDELKEGEKVLEIGEKIAEGETETTPASATA